ncbi:hypothetical protein NUACC21_46330 [Scytonema sp. NUACC21]
MTSKKFRISYIVPSYLVIFCTILLINGCETIDREIFNAKPTPTDSASTSSPTDATASQLSTFQPADSETTNNDEQLDRLVRTRKCLPPNQAEYINGTYKLRWTISGSSYEGLLYMEGRIGKMRIQYFNEVTKSTETVDQTMLLASCTKGLVMFGFNPVVAGTAQQHPTYAADNLIFRRETNGDVTIINYDDRGVTALVEIEPASQ